MDIKVNSIEIFSELSTSPVDWLLANIGDKIRIEIEFECALYSVASSSNPIILNNIDGYVGAGWAVSSNNAFAGMEVGDSVVWGNYATPVTYETKTIIQKLSNNEVQFDATFLATPDNFFSEQSIFSLEKDITALKYYWNFIENAESLNYISKVDGSEQLLKNELIDASDLVAYPMAFVGAKPYQIGSATIQGMGITTTPYYANTFKLIHETYLTPFILATQLTDAINGIAPSYFFNLNCLKYVYNLQALYVYTNPSEYQQVIEYSDLGNTGWFNEKFNGIPTNYSVNDVVYTRWASGSIIPNLELTSAIQTVTFTIDNTTDSPFVDLSTKFVINFAKAPYDITEYQSNTKTQAENFVFDRALQTVGDPDVTGDNFGTGYQVFSEVSVAFVSATQIAITCKIEFGADALDVINDSELPTYSIWVAIQNEALDTEVADKVALLVDLDEYFIDTSDPTMIISESLFLKHYQSDPDTEGNSSLDVFPEDECTAYSRFYIDKNGREDDTILLKSIQLKIKAKNSVTEEEFTMDQQSFDLSTSLLVSGVQYMDIQLNRVFHVPSTEILKKIKVTRRSDLDGADLYFYEVYFPFLVRWEYFIALASVNSDFFDITEPNNGLNQFWHRFTELTDWGLYYEMRILATKNDELLAFTSENQITSNDWDSNAGWLPNSIKAYDIATGDELFDSVAGKKYIFGYQNTRIEALFTWTGGAISLSDYVVNFGIESYEGTGINERTRMSSFWASDADTWFQSIDGSSKTVLSLVGADTVKAEVYVDFTKIPDKPIFKIAARLYDTTITPVTVNKIMEDLTLKQMEDGTQKEME
jgi:hypothetical protein